MPIKILFLDATQADMNKFDKIIDEIEPGSLRIPVLIKKYSEAKCAIGSF